MFNRNRINLYCLNLPIITIFFAKHFFIVIIQTNTVEDKYLSCRKDYRWNTDSDCRACCVPYNPHPPPQKDSARAKHSVGRFPYLSEFWVTSSYQLPASVAKETNWYLPPCASSGSPTSFLPVSNAFKEAILSYSSFRVAA